jgi:hypothetical protein
VGIIARAPCDEGSILAGTCEEPATASGSWILAATILGSSMVFIDGTVVNVALPALQSALGATIAQVQWVIESYALFLAALLLIVGSLGDIYGRRKIFIVGVVLFFKHVSQRTNYETRSAREHSRDSHVNKRTAVRISRTLAVLLCLSTTALAGPPFQTDDPEPIDFRNFEFYTFATSDGTPVETDLFGPALEFNWGALPNVHLHVIVPAATILPGAGPKAFGLGDIELGIKYRFVQETKHRPMIGTFTMFEIPSGSAARGLGVGKTWYKLPLWVQKSFGPWTTYGGGGITLVKAPGYRNFPFAGWLVQRDLGKKWTLGTEVFYHGPEGPATPQTRPGDAGRRRRLLQVP